ncbi:MAG: fibrobacter succinogenes major paralogous domain-containing protein [Bacteroidetes bacterium]|nr:fibrobacter succinogenes major paralogous domain-containing protein [Bacteroidota bacterium]
MQKKNIILFYPSLLLCALLILINGCIKLPTTPADPNKNATIPVVTTTPLTSITFTTADCGGTITSTGGSDVFYHGVCWGTNPNPDTSNFKMLVFDADLNFKNLLSALTPNTTYFIRAYAANVKGIGYGNIITFTTLKTGYTVTDIDGNVYKTVQIGRKLWMAENLKTTKYRDGTPIPNITDNSLWRLDSAGAYSEYDNSPTKGAIYGKFYNYFAVLNKKGLAPTGWHIPTDGGDWSELETALGDDVGIMGGKMKETGTAHWKTPNYGADNSSGFTGLGGGMRSPSLTTPFILELERSYWWTNSEGNATKSATTAYIRWLEFNSAQMADYPFDKHYGLYVRCVKD